MEAEKTETTLTPTAEQLVAEAEALFQQGELTLQKAHELRAKGPATHADLTNVVQRVEVVEDRAWNHTTILLFIAAGVAAGLAWWLIDNCDELPICSACRGA